MLPLLNVHFKLLKSRSFLRNITSANMLRSLLVVRHQSLTCENYHMLKFLFNFPSIIYSSFFLWISIFTKIFTNFVLFFVFLLHASVCRIPENNIWYNVLTGFTVKLQSHHMGWLKICFHLTVKLIEATLLGRNRGVSSATEKTTSSYGNASTSGPSSAKECKLVPNQTYQSDLFSNTTHHWHHPKTKAKIE